MSKANQCGGGKGEDTNFKRKNFTVNICVYKLSYQNTQKPSRDCVTGNWARSPHKKNKEHKSGGNTADTETAI